MRTRKLFVLMAFIAIYFPLNAQFHLNFRSGYLINFKGDTIHGFINDGGGILNSKYCIFKKETYSEPEKYYPKDILGYNIGNEKAYKSLEIDKKGRKKQVFAEIILGANTSLLYYWKGKETKYFLSFENGRIIPLTKLFVSTTQHKNMQKQENESERANLYKDSLYYLFYDHDSLLYLIDKVSYTANSLKNITIKYNQLNCKKEPCIKYQKDFSLSKPHFGFFTGFNAARVNIEKVRHFVPSIPIGIYYNFPMALINDRFSFQMELRGNIYKYNQNNVVFPAFTRDVKVESYSLTIPLYLKYKLIKSRFSASIGLGKETSIFWGSSMPSYTKKGLDIPGGGWFVDFNLDYKVNSIYSIFGGIRYVNNFELKVTPNYIPLDDSLSGFIIDKSYKVEATYKAISANLILPSFYLGINF